jgi:AcrR family transcriptional regulator
MGDIVAPVDDDVKDEPPNGQRARSLRTRQKIVEAAFERFAAEGYAATLDEIARRAGVAVQTVKFVFHTKAELLLEVIGSVAAGSNARPTDEQPWFVEAISGRNGHRALALTVEFGTAIYERLAPLSAAIATAATVDRDVADRRAKTIAARRAGLAKIVEALRRGGDLTADLDVTEATDVLFVLQSPENFHAFTAVSGWPVNRYKAWQYKTLCTALLARTTVASRRRESADLAFSELVR